MLKVESYKKGIILSSVFNIFNKGLVFVNSLIIAYYFGTQLRLDVYFYSYNTILIIAGFITSLNSTILIPESMRIRIESGETASINFLNFFIFTYLGLALALCFLFYIDPVGAFTRLSKYERELLSANSDILYLAVPLILLVCITTLLTDILASHKFFTVPVIVGAINAIFSLAFVVIFHNTLNIQSVVLGLLISHLINIILLLFLLKSAVNWRFRKFKIPGPKVWRNVFYAQTGNILTTFAGYAPLYLLSGLGPGIIAGLNYAQQIVTQPTSLIVNQVSAVSRIKFNELYNKRHYKRINEVFTSSVKMLLFILIPISCLGFIYADEVIVFLYKRGSFNDSSVVISSGFFKYLILSLPFTAIISLAGGLYMAAQLIKVSILYQVSSNALLVWLIYYFISKFSYVGYPYAFLLVNLLNVIVVYVFCKLFFPYIQYLSILKHLLLLIAVNVLICFFVKKLAVLIVGSGILFQLLAGSSVYILCLLVINTFFKINIDVYLFLKASWAKVIKLSPVKF